MNDHEIHSCIDEKNKQLVKDVTTLIEGFTSTMTLLITTENQNIKHSIDQLTERVAQQNGSVRKLNEWKAKAEGEEIGEAREKSKNQLGFGRTAQIVVICLMCLSGFSGVAGIYISLKKDNNMMEYYDHLERQLKKKVDKELSPVTRGLHPTPIIPLDSTTTTEEKEEDKVDSNK
jgi:hypothetical protein